MRDTSIGEGISDNAEVKVNVYSTKRNPKYMNGHVEGLFLG